MKIRAVVVWFREPVRMRSGAFPKTSLSFEVQVGGGADTAAAAEQLLRSAQHPENAPEGEAGQIMQGMVSAIAQLQATMKGAPTPGVRLLAGWVEFLTAAGELLLVPQEQVAWIELGAETERA